MKTSIPDAMTVRKIYLNLVRGRSVRVLEDAEQGALTWHVVRLLHLVIQRLL